MIEFMSAATLTGEVFQRLGGGRHTLLGFEITIVQRHRIIAQIGESGVQACRLKHFDSLTCQLAVNRLLAGAAGRHQNSWHGHISRFQDI